MAVPPASFRHIKFDLGFLDHSGTSAGVGVWFYLAGWKRKLLEGGRKEESTGFFSRRARSTVLLFRLPTDEARLL